MRYYQAFGLGIQSALPLPDLVESPGGRSDVLIRIDQIAHGDRPRPQVEDDYETFRVTPDGVLCAWDQIGTYYVRDGREIIVEPAPGADERLVRLPLLGTVFAILLHQRGRLVIHASAVAVDGKAAAFIGHKGWGKSTLAATLYGQGHRLLTDDVGSFDLDEVRGPLIDPGFPMFKLWPDAAASSLGDDPATLPLIGAQFEKRARRADAGFSLEPVALGALYVLADGSDVTIEPLSSPEATLQLITHSFIARLGTPGLHGSAAARHLKQCAQVARRVPCYRLARPRSAALLRSTAQLVANHMQGRLAGVTPTKQSALSYATAHPAAR